MVLNSGMDDIDLVIKFRVNGFDYVVYATSDTIMKCFICCNIGHVVRNCSRRNVNTEQQNISVEPNLVESPTVVPTAPEVNSSADKTEGSRLEEDPRSEPDLIMFADGPEAVNGEPCMVEPEMAGLSLRSPAVLFSKALLPISCEIEEIVEGRLLKMKGEVSEPQYDFSECICTHKRVRKSFVF